MEWQLKGEGAANAVFLYLGDDPELRGHILRVRKAEAHVSSLVDQIIWETALNWSAASVVERELAYVSGVMGSGLGDAFVFPGEPYPLPAALQSYTLSAEQQGTAALSPRGGVMCAKAGFPALLQPDHTTFNAGGLPGYEGVGPAVCLELKPKWGLQPGEGIAPLPPPAPAPAKPDGAASAVAEVVAAAEAAAAGAHDAAAAALTAAALAEATAELVAQEAAAAKLAGGMADARRHYPRFLLHTLHRHVKEGTPLSGYNPLDLFSCDPPRMQRALRSLVEVPGNNLKVFRDGALMFGGAHRGDDTGEGGAAGVFARAVAGLLPEGGAGGAAGVVDTVVRLVAAAVLQSGALPRLRAVQLLDAVGARGALELYARVLAAVQAGQLRPGAAAGWDQPLAALRAYLTSVTAKDCGLMVTLQRVQPAAAGAEGAAAGAGGSRRKLPLVALVADEATGLSFMVKVAFVDLDIKASSKIPKHAELDRKLAATAAAHPEQLEAVRAAAGWELPA